MNTQTSRTQKAARDRAWRRIRQLTETAALELGAGGLRVCWDQYGATLSQDDGEHRYSYRLPIKDLAGRSAEKHIERAIESIRAKGAA